MPDLVRAFVALELSEPQRATLREFTRQLQAAPGARAARWVAPELAHLTVKFLGEVPRPRLAAVTEVLAQVGRGHAPFTLQPAGVGMFPERGQPRVVWVGLGLGAAQFDALALAVDEASAGLGFARETRPPAAHITLARVRREATASEAHALGAAVRGAQAPEFPATVISGLSLMRSDLSSAGPRYTRLGAFALELSAEA